MAANINKTTVFPYKHVFFVFYFSLFTFLFFSLFIFFIFFIFFYFLLSISNFLFLSSGTAAIVTQILNAGIIMVRKLISSRELWNFKANQLKLGVLSGTSQGSLVFFP